MRRRSTRCACFRRHHLGLRSGKAGAKLALAEGPTWVGTVGGAGLEERVKAAMLDRLHASGRPMGEVLTYGLHRGAKGYEVVALDSLCGGRVTVSIDVLHPTPHVLLMGGGHCAVAFAKVAEQLGWRTSVQDSREAYADEAHHPAAAERHVNSVDEFSPLKTRPRWLDFQTSCCSAMTMRRIGHVCMASSNTSTLQA